MLSGLILSALLLVAAPAPAGSAVVEPFGRTLAGEPVMRSTFQNDRGMRVSAIDYGATIVAVEIPDRRGHFENVVLSLPDLPGYERTQRRWASVIGRYAGRIDGGFVLDGRVHRLEPGRNGVTLHGGSQGYDRRVWTRRLASDAASTSVIFSLTSRDGDQRFPGGLIISVTYRLSRAANQLDIEYEASADAATVINLTNHGHWNLGGAASGSIAGHRIWIDADRFAPTDDRKIPTGALESVATLPLDFRVMAAIGPRLRAMGPMLAPSQGYDHSLVFRERETGRLACVAVIEEPESGRRMEIATTEPSVQFNSGNGFDGSEVGSEGVAYRQYAGLAFETQHLPDSPNHPGFPSTTLRPGQTFRSVTRYFFPDPSPAAVSSSQRRNAETSCGAPGS